MLYVKIYAIVNPVNDDVLYIGASRTPKVRYANHSTGKSWRGQQYTHRQKTILKMIDLGVKPELLILDDVPFPEVPFFEEFYMQLFKSWGYNIQQDRSGYQTNKRFFNDNEKVYIPSFGFWGIVVHHDYDDELHVKVFIEQTQRIMKVFVCDVQNMAEYNEQNN